jgi:hypothetical protein
MCVKENNYVPFKFVKSIRKRSNPSEIVAHSYAKNSIDNPFHDSNNTNHTVKTV